MLTFPKLRLLSSKAQGCKDFWKLSKPHAMFVFIRQLSLSTPKWVPMTQGFSHFAGFLLPFVLAKLATSSMRVKLNRKSYFLLPISPILIHYQDFSICVWTSVHSRFECPEQHFIRYLVRVAEVWHVYWPVLIEMISFLSVISRQDMGLPETGTITHVVLTQFFVTTGLLWKYHLNI